MLIPTFLSFYYFTNFMFSFAFGHMDHDKDVFSPLLGSTAPRINKLPARASSKSPLATHVSFFFFQTQGKINSTYANRVLGPTQTDS